MSSQNKKKAAKRILALSVDNTTNLWHGILEGIKVFEQSGNSGRVPAMFVLTDGQPNCHHPLQGYVSAVRDMLPLPAAIHTFGFGNDIKSGLLKSIAEVGGGSYSFIPDAGMVGTVFVNAVAHLQSTYANRCVLEVTYPESFLLETTTGDTVDSQAHDRFDNSLILTVDGTRQQRLVINLGNLQYGQSRDIYLNSKLPAWGGNSGKFAIHAKLRYSRMREVEYVVNTTQDMTEETSLPEPEIAYHQSRSMVCHFLSDLFPFLQDGEHDLNMLRFDTSGKAQSKYESLVAAIPAKNFSDPLNTALMRDVCGQINLAMHNSDFLRTWAPHYFLSLWDAHAKQVQNTFKDPGVQVYDMHSPLFLKCQKDLTLAFNMTVKPPPPSLKADADENYSTGDAPISMSSFNNSDYPCFAASSSVTLAGGRSLPVSGLRKDMMVLTPRGGRKVAAVLKTRVREIVLCNVDGLLITPWHPVKRDNGWTFPGKVAKKGVRYSGAIYSVLLESDRDFEAHAIQVGGVWAVTLGHGILSGQDARAHRFLGDYPKISKAFSTVGVRPDGVVAQGRIGRASTWASLAWYALLAQAGFSQRPKWWLLWPGAIPARRPPPTWGQHASALVAISTWTAAVDH
ncbi:hypothetical protein JX265_012844 [Neoarthrinium moseri]|uniref:VWFA domain-containing protein n=1 Tax=Neoarthrinium moseri TaxID=1658444 RepID=A0A9Q0AJA2_9PEZI|nr:hypothetical protein JX265_012844 [Neoarthrinium moseri]